jgi:hypothetical protein
MIKERDLLFFGKDELYGTKYAIKLSEVVLNTDKIIVVNKDSNFYGWYENEEGEWVVEMFNDKDHVGKFVVEKLLN